MYRFMDEENGKPHPPTNGKPTTDTLISMENIWKTYQMGVEELHALRDVSFKVQKGEYLAIIGPSSSGKSTLMNLIGCLDSPTKGDYWINGHLVSDMSVEIMALFEKLHAEGNTIIVVTHEHDIAERAHRVITIRDGQIEKDEKIR